MGSIIEFSEAVRALLRGGEVVEGTAVKVITSDAGSTIGAAVKSTVTTGNGTSATIYQMTDAAIEGGRVVSQTGTTTGVAFLTTSIPTACAAIAPCLGVAAGYGLYSISPDFWRDVSNNLIAMGQTIGNSCIAYFNGENIGYSRQTIEIIKNALVNAGMFNNQYKPPHIDIDTKKVTMGSLSVEASKELCIAYVNSCNIPLEYKGYAVNFIRGYTGTYPLMIQHYYYKASPLSNFSISVWVVYNQPGTDMTYSGEGDNCFVPFSGSRVGRWTVGGYYGDGEGFPFSEINPSPYFEWEAHTPSDFSGCDKYFPEFGSYDPNANLQEDATYPSGDEEFPLTYPNWLPWEYPIHDPQGELPEVYPMKYPETDPDPYPDQEGAQDPDPENVPDTWTEIIPDFDLPLPWDGILPGIDPDDWTDPDPLPDPVPPVPEPIPPDPNPDPDPGTPVPVPPMPASVTSNKLFTVYNPTASQLGQLGGYLWDSDLMEILRKIWQNPLDGIISLIQVYCTPSTGGSKHIILGYLDSEVSAAEVTSQFVEINCGTVELKEKKKNCTDYVPYVSVHLYLPFIGIVELDANECMNGDISVKYKVDVYTGTCLAEVKVTRDKDMTSGTVLYTFSGNCSQQIPLTSGSALGLLTSLASGAASALALATGGGLGVITAANTIGHTISRDLLHVSHSGSLSANAGIMGGKKPYLIVGRQAGYDANNYNSYYGYPANKTVPLSACSGFTRVKACRLRSTATSEENQRILDLLYEGVII